MKNLKKILAFALVAISLFAIALPAFAALPPQPKIECVRCSRGVHDGIFVSAVAGKTTFGQDYIQWTIRCAGCGTPYYPITYL